MPVRIVICILSVVLRFLTCSAAPTCMEFELEVEKLRKKYRSEKQLPLLEERSKVLSDTSGGAAEESGTPACKGFWLRAMQNDDDYAGIIQEHDEPVLEYLQDIRKTDLDAEFEQKGLKLEYVFKPNPFFTNESLWVEFHTDYQRESYKPYMDPDCIEIKSCDIDWKPGKNVTVAIVEKKVKGGGAKKAKQKAKAKEEPRASFFRFMFPKLKDGEPLPAILKSMLGGEDDEDDDDDDEDATGEVMREMYGFGMSIGDQLIPYAVRFYTGEAGDKDDDDDDEDEEEEEEDTEDDDDDEDDDVPPAKSAAKKKPHKKGGAGAAEPGAKQEECKQQ